MEDRVFVPKGWGYEDWIVNKEEYCGKLLFFKKGKRYGWSDDKSDLNTEVTVLKAGDTFYVPVGMRHQMTGLTDVEMFEFSTQHFDEDSIRIEKGS